MVSDPASIILCPLFHLQKKESPWSTDFGNFEKPLKPEQRPGA